jgi:predicted transcriptional regulator
MTRTAATKSALVSVKLDQDDKNRIASLSLSKNRTPHYLMKEAIREYIVREEARQSLIDEAKASWEEHRQTGSHIMLEEFGSWVSSLEKHPKNSMPPCHE